MFYHLRTTKTIHSNLQNFWSLGTPIYNGTEDVPRRPPYHQIELHCQNTHIQS